VFERYRLTVIERLPVHEAVPTWLLHSGDYHALIKAHWCISVKAFKRTTKLKEREEYAAHRITFCPRGRPTNILGHSQTTSRSERLGVTHARSGREGQPEGSGTASRSHV